MSKIRQIIFLLLTCMQVSCLNSAKDLPFAYEEIFFWKWAGAYEVWVDSNIINTKKWIKRPYETWVNILSVKYVGEKKSSPQKDCLFYKVPGKDKNNALIMVTTIKPDKTCSMNKGFTQQEKFSLEKMKVFYSYTHDLPLNESNFLDKNHLLLVMQKRGKEYFYKIPILNFNLLDTQKSSFLIKKKRFQNSTKQNFIPGLEVLSVSKEISRWPSKIKVLNNDFENRFFNRTLKACHTLGPRCNAILKYECNKCESTWFEVAGGACSTINNKYCGVNRCGQRGELACPRGSRHVGIALKTNCEVDSPTGICAQGLRPTCLEKKFLVCL